MKSFFWVAFWVVYLNLLQIILNDTYIFYIKNRA